MLYCAFFYICIRYWCYVHFVFHTLKAFFLGCTSLSYIRIYYFTNAVCDIILCCVAMHCIVLYCIIISYYSTILCSRTSSFACIHTYIHTYIHACMHTYIHTYIHTYTYIYRETRNFVLCRIVWFYFVHIMLHYVIICYTRLYSGIWP